MGDHTLVPAEEMMETFQLILTQHGFAKEKARLCAAVFTGNSVDGVSTHGVNRFALFIQYVKEGLVKKDAVPSLVSGFHGMEQWNGNLGPGPLNAISATERAIELAGKYGIGCVGLSNTNHWMRAGYYGRIATKNKMVMVAWTNAVANMPAFGATGSKLGNNPLMVAVPYRDDAIVLDMAMSQYSYGALELAAAKGEPLEVAGGYDANGQLTRDPSLILASGRTLPVGYWKGTGLSLLLDILAVVLSNGLATWQISALPKEHSVSQVFICMDLLKLANFPAIEESIRAIIEDYHQSPMEKNNDVAQYPGERVERVRKTNLENGVPVLNNIWDTILKLKQ